MSKTTPLSSPNEPDAVYRERIRAIDNIPSYERMKSLIDSILENGESVLVENQGYGFADWDLYADSEDAIYLSKRKWYNRFTFVIPPQL